MCSLDVCTDPARGVRRGTISHVTGDDDDVQEPTDQPYGNRDCAFGDPAGNLIRIQELSDG